jgi:flagellar biosynthesis/type III secretory pathway protein FliH
MSPLKLEDFTESSPIPEMVGGADPDEDLRLAAYEEGYGAGWEDATTAQSDARAEREAEAARHLQMLSFGYHEARQHVMKSLEPLLHEMVAQLLPAMARAALVPVVMETLVPLADRMADAPVTLRVAPEVRDLVDRLLPATTQGIPMRIVEDPALTGGQVMVAAPTASGPAEARIDLDAATAAIAQAVADFFDLQPTEHADAG